jgi:hypothetical protein
MTVVPLFVLVGSQAADLREKERNTEFGLQARQLQNIYPLSGRRVPRYDVVMRLYRW